MSRSLTNGVYTLLLVLLLVLFWGPLSHWLETAFHVDATIAFITTMATLAVTVALTVRFVRERL